MKIKELRNKSNAELEKLLMESRAKLRDMRFQVLSDQHKQVHEVKGLKLLIARILTLLNEPQTKTGEESVLKSDSQKDLNT